MRGFKYGSYICKSCGAKGKVWVESEVYKRQLCPKCLDKEDGVDYFTHPEHLLKRS